MRIDTHTHCFPDSLAPRAIGKLEEYDMLERRCDGTLSGLLSILDRDGIDRAFVLNIATNPHQQEKVNAFALSINHYDNRIYSFGSVHPASENIRETVKRIKESGLYGIKLHPDFMGYDIASDEMAPILSAAAEYGVPVVIHAGWDPSSPHHVHARPEDVAKVLERYPSLRLCAAHFGDMSDPEAVLRHLCGRNVWFDTGFAVCGRIAPENAKRILENHDPDKIMFGSDMPWESPKETVDFLATLGLSEERMEKITSKNALSFINI